VLGFHQAAMSYELDFAAGITTFVFRCASARRGGCPHETMPTWVDGAKGIRRWVARAVMALTTWTCRVGQSDNSALSMMNDRLDDTVNQCSAPVCRYIPQRH